MSSWWPARGGHVEITICRLRACAATDELLDLLDTHSHEHTSKMARELERGTNLEYPSEKSCF